jgi:hypothetical protein
MPCLPAVVITDIESSTTLYEMLPTSVMDVATHLHHDTVRAMCLKHKVRLT